MTTNIVMPQLGESVVEGTVGKWLKQVGDKIEQYEPVMEVITDKVTTEIPSPASGTLLQIARARRHDRESRNRACRDRRAG